MEEILHHLACKNPVNNGMNYLLTGAGFLPSTVSLKVLPPPKTNDRSLKNRLEEDPFLLKWPLFRGRIFDRENTLAV